MDTLLVIGTVLGAAIGFAHAAYLWRSAAREGDAGVLTLYRGAWAIALWTLFGSYVLLLWLIGAIASGFSPRRAGNVD